MLSIQSFVFNPIQENTYLVADTQTKEALVIDAGCLFPEEQQELAQMIQKQELSLRYVLNTHLHLDHCFGNAFLKREFGISPWAHEGDENTLNMIQAYAQSFGIPFHDVPEPIGKYLHEGDEITLGAYTFQVLEVPGHSKGGLAFYCASEKVVFTGDSLFHYSIGRTDLPGGDYSTLITSVLNKLMTLPGDTKVYCGHGPSTTISEEQTYNPYL